MPRIDISDYDDSSESPNRIRIKQQKPRNPHVQELFENGKYRPKREKDKKREVPVFDKRNYDKY